MNTYYFLEKEASRRMAEFQQWAKQNRLAILAQQGARRETQKLKPRWFGTLLRISPLSYVGRRLMEADPGAIPQ